MLAWHFTNGGRLRDGRPVPPVGETLKHEEPLVLCASGLHASKQLLDALIYAPGTMLHRVECGGDMLEVDDKLVCSERTIIASADMRWALVEFAEDCAKRAAYHADAAAYRAAYAADAAAYAVEAARAADAAYAAEAARAADAAYAAAYAAYHAAYHADAEREHQNSTLELWFECMKGA